MTLSFEEADQLANPTRLRAFIKQYGIDYTVLLAGEPDDVEAKVPQAVNLNAFPTTFLLGRDGRVRAVHAGFPSPGSGEFYSKAERAHHRASRTAARRARIGHVLGRRESSDEWGSPGIFRRDGEVANAAACKAAIRGFESLSRLQSPTDSDTPLAGMTRKGVSL